MGEIQVHEFITLDGVIDNPAWSAEYSFTVEMGTTIGAIMGSSEALLMGRTTYELFAPSWSARTEAEDPGAPFMNESPKYVVSTTLRDPEWNNTTVIGGYDADRIRALTQEADGNIYVSGSGTLVRALVADRLVAELHLFVYPVVLGSGMRLFADGMQAKLRLLQSEPYDNGVVHLAYGPAA
jgi:dihydrofolate reductase